MGQQAAIVYRSSNDHWIGKYLHDEIKHCLLCYMERGHWVTLDYTLDGLIVDVSQSLPAGVYYQSVVVNKKSIFPALPTCVGMVKYAIGMNNPFILTPWQLLRSIESGK